MKDDGGSAFPFAINVGGSAGIVTPDKCKGMGGMSLRDYFAAHISVRELEAWLSICHNSYPAARYAFADSMLSERAKEK